MEKEIDIRVAERIRALNDGEKQFCRDGQVYKRGNSWTYCRDAFVKGSRAEEADYDALALQLAFYLASWGMYRGSSFLLNMDYKIHIEPVKMMMEMQYRELFTIGNPFADVEKAKNYEKLLFGEEGIYCRLEKYYLEAHRAFPKDEKKALEYESDTLMTKILLGVYGCIPAYDRFFKCGLSLFGRQQWLNNKGNALCSGPKSLRALLRSGKLQEELNEFCRAHEEYTYMKAVDMYFFSLGEVFERTFSLMEEEKRDAQKVSDRKQGIETLKEKIRNTYLR